MHNVEFAYAIHLDKLCYVMYCALCAWLKKLLSLVFLVAIETMGARTANYFGDSVVDERFCIIAMVEQKRGAFIVLEGLDRSGKTTQATKLVQKIKGMNKPCTLMKFPGKHLHSLFGGT